MKKILLIFAVIMTCTACGDIEPVDAGLTPVVGGGATGSTGTLTIQGVSRTVGSLIALEEAAAAGLPAIVTISYLSDNDALFLLVDAAITAGTYDLDTTAVEIASVFTEDIVNGVATTTYFDESGSVVITSHDVTAKTMSGSFNISYLDLGGSLTRTASGTFTVTY